MAAMEKSADKKRSRAQSAAAEEELEIDLNLPEPPSKKAKRLAKKAGTKPEQKVETSTTNDDKSNGAIGTSQQKTSQSQDDTTSKRSAWAIWIGNLEFSVTKDNLRTFLSSRGDIESSQITRVNMPAPAKQEARPGAKRLHRGFAYVDFADEDSMNKAIALSEELFAGRKVLIKNAKSFVGRPDPQTTTETPQTKSKHPPNKRVWVGNLSYDIDPDDLRKHFSQAGEVEDVSLMTWEDSGRCKGFGFVRFGELDAAQAAVRGYIFKEPGVDDEDGSDDAGANEAAKTEAAKPLKRKKPRKWYINRLFARQLDVQFAEDSSTRYKKRYGQDKS